MLSRKIFENLPIAMTILVLFQQFLDKFWFNFCAPNSDVLHQMRCILFTNFALCVLKV